LYWSIHKEELSREGPEAPLYGEISKSSSEQLKAPVVIFAVEDAILVYGIAAALANRADALMSLQANAGAYDASYPGLPLLGVVTTGDKTSERIEEYTAEQIFKACTQADLTPNELFIACVRFTQTTKSSNFKARLTPALIEWVRRKWSYVLDQQTFYLTNPTFNVPLIKAALGGLGNDLGQLGKLLVALEPALKTRLGDVFRKYLQSL
jgi:hypothetical protein